MDRLFATIRMAPSRLKVRMLMVKNMDFGQITIRPDKWPREGTTRMAKRWVIGSFGMTRAIWSKKFDLNLAAKINPPFLVSNGVVTGKMNHYWNILSGKNCRGNPRRQRVPVMRPARSWNINRIFSLVLAERADRHCRIRAGSTQHGRV